MWDKLKESVNNIFTAGEKARTALKTPSYHKVDPEYQKSLQTKFLKYAISKPAWYLQDSYNRVQRERTPNIENFKFRDPMKTQQQHEMKRPAYKAFSSYMSEKLENLRNRPAEGIKRMKENAPAWLKKTGQFAVDVAREIPRGGARIGMALNNPNMPYSKTPTGGLEKFVYGEEPIESYNLANRKFGQSRGLSSNQIDKTLPAFMAGGLLLDASAPGVDDVGKKVGKKFLTENLVQTAQEAGEVILKGMDKTARLKHLMDYPAKLSEMGFNKEAIEKISAGQAATILKNGLNPEKFGLTVARELPITKTIDDFKSAMRTWIGGRDSSKIEAIIKAKEFQDLDAMGQEGFRMVQSGKFTKTFENLRSYFDSARQRLVDAGLPVAYHNNYLPHLWKNTDEEVEIALGRKLATNTKFSLQKIWKTYEDGIAGGLTPKFNSLKDLVGSYEQGIGKAIADKNFFSWLKDNGVIKPASQAPAGWTSISADHFPIAGKEVFKASAEVADHINNYLSTPTGIMPSIASFSTAIKNIVLSAGIPSIKKLGNIGSGMNTLGLMSVTKSTLSNPNPIKGFTRAMEYLINPNKATKYVEENMARMPDFVKHGGVISVEDWEFLKPYAEETNNLIKKTANKVIDFNHKYFEDKIFNSILPALKLQTYDDVVENLAKHLPDIEAKREAAKQVNSIFGGLNQSFLLRNKDTQNFMRAFLMAPDLLESNGRIAVGMGKALLNPSSPVGKEYRTFARNFLLHRASTELVNKMATGHWQSENESVTNKVGYIETPYYLPNGKRMDFKVPGIDSLRLPVEFAMHLANGDVNSAIHMVQNRLSAPAAMALAQGTNKDYRNKDIANPEDSLPKQLLDRGVAAAGSFLPSYVKAPINLALGKQGGLETAAQMIEAPVAFRGGPTNKTSQKTIDLMQQGGASGKDIHDTIEASKPYNKPKKLTAEQEAKNLAEGLPINTQRNWLGKPITGSQDDATGQEMDGSVGMAGTLNQYAKEAKATSDKKALVKQIYESLDTDEQITKALKANGITEREAINFMVKDLTISSGQRPEYLYSIIRETQSKDEFVTTIAEMAKDDLLTAEVVKYWEDAGTISDSTGKEIRNIIKAVKGQKITGGGSGKSKGKPPKLTLPTLKMSNLNVKMPKLSTANDIYKFKPKTVGKAKQVAKLPTLSDMKLAVAKMETNKLTAVPQGFSR